MDKMPDETTKAKEIFNQPCKNLTDVGTYCYAALCSVALNKLFSDQDCNKEFISKFVTLLTSHLGQSAVVKDTMLALATEIDVSDYSSFVDTLKKEEIVQNEGTAVVVQDLLVLVLSEGCYDARSRTFVKFIALTLQVPWDEVERVEDEIVEKFNEAAHELSEEEQKERDKAARNRKIKKYALLTTATIGGGVLLGVTGGLAAPLIAAGAGAVIGTAGAAALGSIAGVAIIGSLFGVAGAGLGAYKMKKRVGDIEEFAFVPLSQGSQLHVTIAITGWLTEYCSDFLIPWRGLANSREQYSLRYESKYLKQLGSAMDYLVNAAITSATSEALKYTVLSGLMAAIAWPAAILSASSIIDNPWSVMANRAQAVGKQLAEVLLSRQQGKRPVTLIGYSLGARVIYYCLQEMSSRKNCEGIIEDAILLGAPVPNSASDWSKLKRVVAGRIVNGYCRGDWMLKFLYRTASVQLSIAGLGPVDWTDRRMHNIDLTDKGLVSGHMDYQYNLDKILEIIGVRVKPYAKESESSESLKKWVEINKGLREEAGSKQGMHASKTSDQIAHSSKMSSRVKSDGDIIQHAGHIPATATDEKTAKPLEKQKSIDESVTVVESILNELIVKVTDESEGHIESLGETESPFDSVVHSKGQDETESAFASEGHIKGQGETKSPFTSES